ncbi:TPA: DEAD/DEAH box helicase family protein, partial [Streptococcus pyogenes]
MQLRPYQEEARSAVQKEWEEGRKRTLLVLPTGCGKTIVFSKII